MEQDPLANDAPSAKTFRLMVDILAKHKPRFWLLENVLGCKLLTCERERASHLL